MAVKQGSSFNRAFFVHWTYLLFYWKERKKKEKKAKMKKKPKQFHFVCIPGQH